MKTLLIAAVLSFCACCAVSASGSDWQFNFCYSLFTGSRAGSADGYDTSDAAYGGAPRFNAAVYHPEAGGSWGGPAGFYARDMRALLQTPGSSQTWRIYFWGNPDLEPGWTYMPFTWDPAVPQEVFGQIQFTLTYVRSAIDISDPWNTVGEVWDLNIYREAGMMFPVYRTDDGLTGYVLDLTATVIPEPPVLAGFAMALAGLAVFRKR